MNQPRGRKPFMPNLLRGAEVQAINSEFAVQAQTYRLQFRCDACIYFLERSRLCSVGWPNAMLLADPIEAIDRNGQPVFCKAFEMDDL